MDETAKRASLWHRIHAWLHRHPRRTLIVSGVALTLAAALVTAALFYRNPVPAAVSPVATTPAKPKPLPVKYYSPLNGTEVTNAADSKRPVTAIMIENSPDARPQSGLKDAEVVYEAIAEGGITRFLALYQQNKPQLIGPVRSVRMYYVDWLAPYNASVAHVGGSAAALAEVRNGSYRDIDQFFNAGSYWRATDRYAPHNVYTSFEKLDALNARKGYTESNFTSFPRTDGKASSTPDAKSININFSGALYDTHYDYDAASNTYLRSVGGAPHLDREKGQIAPSTVIAMVVNMSLVMEDGYRESITTTGTGRAVIFQNGTATEATWHKADRASPLEFLDANNKPISLVRGQTWIAATPSTTGGGVSWQ